MQRMVLLGLEGGIGAVLGIELFHAGLVHDGGVRQDGDNDVVLGQLIVFGHLDAAQHVGDAGDAHPGELLDLLVRHAKGLQVLLTLLAVEQSQQALGVLVVDGNGHVGVLHVMDPRNVLVADTLDAVAAEAVVQNGRALQGLADGELHAGIALLQQIAGGHRAGGSLEVKQAPARRWPGFFTASNRSARA